MADVDCDSPKCVQAHIRLQEARNRILSICSQLTQLRASAASFNALAAAMLATALAFVALGVALLPIPIFGGILAGVSFGLAALFFGLSIYFATRSGIINGQINDLEKELVAARDEFDKAVAEVQANCPGPPSECWGELDQPTCP